MVVHGKKIEAQWWGETGAPLTLVLLHEGLGSVGLWRDFPEKLAKTTGCRVFVYSRLGYGRSDPVSLPRPLSYMQDEAATWLGQVLDAAGARPCVLVGHSDGASIAALYAAGDDPGLRGIVLMAPHYFVEDMCLAAIAAAREAYAHGDLRARLARHHDDVDGAFLGWNGAWLDPGFRAWDIRAAVARIEVPILQIQGVDDPYGTAAQPLAAAALAPGPVRTLMVPGGHAPHIAAAEATLAAIAGFLHTLPGTA